MPFEIEVVKSNGADILSDEIYGMSSCPSCGFDLADCWSYCPSCGCGPLDGAAQHVSVCTDEGDDPNVFKCSLCGRSYAALQFGNGGEVEWNFCPGCMARLV